MAAILGLLCVVFIWGIVKPSKFHEQLKLHTRLRNVVAFVVVVFIGNVLGIGAEPQKAQPQTQSKSAVAEVKTESTPSQPKAPVKSLSLDQKIKNTINDKLGPKTNDSPELPRIQELTIIDNKDTSDKADKKVLIGINADTNLTDGLTVTGMLMDGAKAFQAIFPLDSKITEVQVQFWIETVDQYGRTSRDPVMTIALKKETYEKINWENFNYKNLPHVADRFGAYPFVQKELQE